MRDQETIVAEGPAVAHLLKLCRAAKRGFTLREIVARILEEKPEMILDFAHAWEELIARKMVRVRSNGRPCIYELTDE